MLDIFIFSCRSKPKRRQHAVNNSEIPAALKPRVSDNPFKGPYQAAPRQNRDLRSVFQQQRVAMGRRPGGAADFADYIHYFAAM